MRELNFPHYLPKFRGCDENGQWHYGYNFGSPYGRYGYVGQSMGHYGVVKRETISISTGFYDKNGKEIYEGDILNYGGRIVCVYWNGEGFQWDTALLSYNVVDRDMWRMGEGHTLGLIAAEGPLTGEITTVIIGNKWDNPELLPKEEEKSQTFEPF